MGNRILAPSITGLLDVLRAYSATGSCVDATPLRTYARKPARSDGITSADPDAGRYVRTSDAKLPTEPTPATTAKTKAATKKTTIKTVVKELYGYEATLLVNGSTQPVDGRIAPPVIVGGYVLERPGHRPGGAAVDVLRHAVANGWPTGLLATDRAYNNSDADTYQLPARALGFDHLFDYRDDQLGVQAEHAGRSRSRAGGAAQTHRHC